MPQRWLTTTLIRIHQHAAQGSVRFTLKALQELDELGLGLDEDDGLDIVANLSARDFSERVLSSLTNEWMYVFKPMVAETVIYIKLIVRVDCVIISFHEDRDQTDEDND